MAQVIFSGTVTAQAAAGEAVIITVTLPDNTIETLTATTLADRTYSVTKEYMVAGNYKAKAHGDADGIYKAWDSEEQPFTIALTDRTGTLVVTIA
jgi:hypothetical protein